MTPTALPAPLPCANDDYLFAFGCSVHTPLHFNRHAIASSFLLSGGCGNRFRRVLQLEYSTTSSSFGTLLWFDFTPINACIGCHDITPTSAAQHDAFAVAIDGRAMQFRDPG